MEQSVWLVLTQGKRIALKKPCDLVLERLVGQGSWPWNSLEDSIGKRIRLGFPLKLERFWPWLIAYILCPLSHAYLWFGSCLMIENINIIKRKKEANKRLSKSCITSSYHSREITSSLCPRFLNMVSELRWQVKEGQLNKGLSITQRLKF